MDRPEWNRLYKRLKPGDMVVFDSVSRMSRNVVEGAELYEKMYNMGIDLVFLNEPCCNTENYRKAQSQSIPSTGNDIADIYIEATNKVLMLLAKRQITVTFEQSQKERDDICTRVRDGMRSKKEEAERNGLTVSYGAKRGAKLTTRKSISAKEKILKYSRTFGGSLSDADCIKLIGISRKSYYKYKAELRNDSLADEIRNNS